MKEEGSKKNKIKASRAKFCSYIKNKYIKRRRRKKKSLTREKCFVPQHKRQRNVTPEFI